MWVVKIGGSLFPEEAIKLCKYLQSYQVLIICGGGIFADQIRQYDHLKSFSPSAAHKAAILCMDIMGMLLADYVPSSELIRFPDEAEVVINRRRLPILIPSHLFDLNDPLEHSWRVTSDSISLYIAQLLKAKLLIATDVDGIFTGDPSKDGAQFIPEISAKKLLNFGETSVDRALPELLIKYGYNCHVVNGKYPERVLSIIEGKKSIHTFIGGL